jgi:fucose permease
MLAFLIMGFGDVSGPMVSLAKDSFEISNFMAQLLPLCGFIMFGVLSIPMGIFQDRKGKKRTLGLGLIFAFLGLMLPVIGGMVGIMVDLQPWMFYLLLASVLLLGVGATILQVAGNPIMREVSAEGNFSSNLSLAQTVKAIGSSLCFLLPTLLNIWLQSENKTAWTFLFPIYGAFVLITFVLISRIDIKEKTTTDKPASLKSCFNLLGNSYVLAMVLGIFVYVGAEVSMSSQVSVLMKDGFGFSFKNMLWISWLLFFLPILIGRFMGGIILRSVKAKTFLIITTFLSISGIIFMLFGNMYLAFAGIVAVGLGFANIFPLIFSITIEKMPERANELSGLMVTAIVGGAFIPPITGLVADISHSVLLSFVVPLICLIYIIIISLFAGKKKTVTA